MALLMKSHTPECAKIEQFAATITPLKSYHFCLQDFDTKDYMLEFHGRSITTTQQQFRHMAGNRQERASVTQCGTERSFGLPWSFIGIMPKCGARLGNEFWATALDEIARFGKDILQHPG